MKTLLFKQVDNSALIVFRIIFGLLITLEAWGAIATGWVKRVFVEPQFTFNFIGFDFLQVFVGPFMYGYYLLMGSLGLMVCLGYKYRWSMWGYTLLWTLSYLMQKSSYNNHYYLLILICIFMLLVPANAYASIDAKRSPSLRSNAMPNWVNVFIILQLFIVYTYAALAKIYPDWLHAKVPEILMAGKAHYYIVGDILQQKWTHYVIAYFGILFDLLVVPLLLYKPTRKYIFFFSVFFHLFNSIVFQIGIFPYLSLAFSLFFFPAEKVHRWFLKKKDFYQEKAIQVPNYAGAFQLFIVVWFICQIGLPLRHWFIPGDVLYTEEGHRMSWRMMLRTKSGHATYTVVDTKTGEKTIINKAKYLTPKQLRQATTKPDIIWQFAQRIARDYAQQGKEVQVFVRCGIRVNKGSYTPLINPEVDLAAADWNYFKHNTWILLPQNL